MCGSGAAYAPAFAEGVACLRGESEDENVVDRPRIQLRNKVDKEPQPALVRMEENDLAAARPGDRVHGNLQR